MTVRCTAVAPAGALPALAETIAAAKGGDPLAHVTVIVPTNAVGVTARRWLGGHGGVAAIDLVTPARLAERLAGAELAGAGRRPVSTPLLDITVREVLRHAPGDFGPVSDHPSTVTSLRDLHRELRVAGPVALASLRASGRRAAEAARVSSMVAERLAGEWYDEADLIALAIDRIAAGAPLFDRAVAFLPRPDRGLPTELFRAIGARADLHVVLEWVGVPEVDAETVAFARAIGAEVEPLEVTIIPGATTAATTVVSTTDADEEVRHAVRALVDGARVGTPFARMAVVWPTDRPYARLVEHHLDVAGIPWNGRPGTLVTERLVPRFLLDLLQLDRRGIRRNELFALLADVPVKTASGERVSVARWERVARAAGVTRAEHWQPRLAAFAATMRAYDEPRERDAEAAEQLAAFVDGLQRDLGSWSRTRAWADWAAWCERQVLQRLGRSVLDQLDEAERLASDHTNKVLDRLRSLDAISGPVTRRDFRAAFAAEFEVAPGRLGRLGTGVTIGSLAGTAGLDADLTIVLGAAEGLLPPAPVVDPLVGDRERAAAGLPDATARRRRVHRSFLAHLATSGRTVVSVPRGDLRATTTRLPSRWITDHLPDAAAHVVDSHHAGLLATAFPASTGDHRLRGRGAAALLGPERLVEVCADDVAATRGLAMRAGRRSDQLTVYDGDLSGVEIEHFQRVPSASQIEAWPKCPHAYFVRYLLGVRPLDDAGDELALSPIERGNVVHHTLDRFHQLVVAGALAQPGADGWSDDHVRVLLELFDEVADEFERTGRTGRPAHWALDRPTVRADLATWFLLDGRTAAARRARVIHSELRFGYDDPVTLPLPDGSRFPVAGFVDRVDEQVDGQLIVMDHKTGGAGEFTGITADDPTEGGTKFQLPIYAAAALALRGEEAGHTASRVRAEYDFFDKGGYVRHGYTFDDEVWGRVADDLGAVVAGIRSGLYPNVTEPPKFEFSVRCQYCQPDGLGVDERWAEWSVKRHDERLRPWFPLDELVGEERGDVHT
jgi:ATP-dependent helicase/nuclease subunit B